MIPLQQHYNLGSRWFNREHVIKENESSFLHPKLQFLMLARADGGAARVYLTAQYRVQYH
jgi:hypothetical protein